MRLVSSGWIEPATRTRPSTSRWRKPVSSSSLSPGSVTSGYRCWLSVGTPVSPTSMSLWPTWTGQERPAALLYAGDLDPSGEDIDRDFLERTDCWHKVVRVALTPEQVDEFNLPAMPGKATDSRAAGFIARHGALTQTEVDALPPNVLRSLFADAVSQFWDTSRYDDVVADEQAERDNLVEIAEQLADDQEPER